MSVQFTANTTVEGESVSMYFIVPVVSGDTITRFSFFATGTWYHDNKKE